MLLGNKKHKQFVQIKLCLATSAPKKKRKMSSIGKSPRLVNRVKSEFTVTGRRSCTATSTTPANSKIPLPKSPLTPQTAFERKKFITRRRLMVGDATAHLTRSSPSSKVRDVVYQEASERANVCSCDPELQGSESLNPSCIYVNVCSEHAKNAFRWSEYLKRLWILVEKLAQVLVACVLVVMTCIGSINAVYWMFGGKSTKRSADEVHVEDESIFDEDEEEIGGEELHQDLMVLNRNEFSLTETTHAFSLFHVLIMTMARLFNWIGDVLLPGEG